MIQEKLRFSEGSSLIERKCLCCKQFSHRFSFCPKLHYIADKEKIIKKEIFASTFNNRTPFIRKTKKSNNALQKKFDQDTTKSVFSSLSTIKLYNSTMKHANILIIGKK